MWPATRKQPKVTHSRLPFPVPIRDACQPAKWRYPATWIPPSD